MERGVKIVILQYTFMLMMLGVTVQAQPVLVDEIPRGSKNFTKIGDLVYFISGDSLLRTDGTAEGTILLKRGMDNAGDFEEFDGVFYFANAQDPGLSYGKWKELWRSDGTPSGTFILKTSSEYDLEIVDHTPSFLFFKASDISTGLELYRTNGTIAGTALVKDINPGTADGYFDMGAVVGNFLFFAGNNGSSGLELWKSDGTSGGTVMVKDISPGAGNGFHGGSVLSYNGLFYFSGNTVENGIEPWVSDGTDSGTQLLQDIVPGPESSDFMEFKIGNNGVVYFFVFPREHEGTYRGAGDLWKTSGTPGSTARIKTIAYEDSDYHSFLIYKGKVYFFVWETALSGFGGVENALWVTDGTTEGTQRVFGLYTFEGGLTYFEVVNDYMLFYGNHQGYPSPLFKSDGTTDGTTVLTRFNSAGYHMGPRDLTRVDDLLFYGDHDGPAYEGTPDNPGDYYQLFQSDAITTQSVRSIYGGSYIGTDDITEFNSKVLFTTQDDQHNSTDTRKRLWLYDPNKPAENTAFFTLVNADTDEDIQQLNEADIIAIDENTNINIRYNPLETPGSVVFKVDDVATRTETAPPYSLAGDVNGDYAPWQQANPGTYKLTAIPYSEAGGNGTAGEALIINFTIEGESGTEDCLASGTILREYWDGISGNYVSAIPTDKEPTSTNQLTLFEGPTNFDTNYGTRIRGYICPPSTGNYTFWIASNDNSELWLSTDDNPANKVRVAQVTGATNPREWGKFSSQKSTSIHLTASKRYYIEALHKQGVGTDNIAVGWQLADGTMERPIPGNRLSPFSGGDSNMLPAVTITHPEMEQTFDAPATINIEANATDADGSIVKVEFFEGSTKIREDLTSPYGYTWSDVPAGTYILTAKAFDDKGGNSTSAPVNVTVRDESTASGTITREYWSGVQGDKVSDIPVHTASTGTGELTLFEAPSNIGTNYGTRIRGYIFPPVSGDYYFYISSNDHSELWLSNTEDPSDKIMIAYVRGATGIRQWNKFASQRSAPIALTEGNTYYIEALHKQGIGTDNLAVGWRMPDGTFERPIPGNRLLPFEFNPAFTGIQAFNTTGSQHEVGYKQVNIYPNPLQSVNPELTISGYEGIAEPVETQIEIISMTGEVIYTEIISCGGNCHAYIMKINEQLVPGVYMVNLKTNGARLSKRLLVR